MNVGKQPLPWKSESYYPCLSCRVCGGLKGKMHLECLYEC